MDLFADLSHACRVLHFAIDSLPSCCQPITAKNDLSILIDTPTNRVILEEIDE
ncbi:hypothetical protein SAMN02745664_1294 [Moraxella cuniculi DSM 21768]|uniref:Uncharacterized protein n=1 Tax=Moraxella cuniculi DSM 21768 TaxID=1122245 RepID=A0A1N7GAG2_9GAMM|nr:hypothetical protein SAMN02745664_1294 [Moraxella cuniculi DSM 21768]